MSRWKRGAGLWGLVVWLVGGAGLACGGDEGQGERETPECRLNSDCPAPQICVEGLCQPDEAACEGDDCPCLGDADCGAGRACDLESGACFALECLRDNDCGLGQVCLQGRCETDVDADRDRDGVPDTEDSCPEDPNADQEDGDGDGQGDVCDLDDDNDAIPDTLDNCPGAPNPLQGDANGDGQGNACDEAVAGIDVRGALDFSALSGAETGQARVFFSGRDEPVTINAQGAFVADAVLAEPGRFTVRVEWPGFALLVKEFAAPDGEEVVTLPALVMVPAAQGDEAVALQGSARLDGEEDHRDIIVRARVGGSLAATTLTDAQGRFVLQVGPVDHTLELTREGFETREIEVRYDPQGAPGGRFLLGDAPLDEAPPIALTRLTGQARIAVAVEPDWIPQGQRGVTVTVVGERDSRSATALGEPVVLSGLPAGDYLVFVDRPGFSQARGVFSINEQTPEASVSLEARLVNLAQAGLDLGGVRLSGEDLRQVPVLRGGNLAGALMAQAELCRLDLSGASLVGAELSGARLDGALLEGARLDNASLQGASLRSANLRDASLFGANLAQSDLRNGAFDCQGESFDGGRTVLTRANLGSASLIGAAFIPEALPQDGDPCELALQVSPELTGARWDLANLQGADLRAAALEGANLTATLLGDADLSRACLRRATLLRADVSRASLAGADLSDASLLDTLMNAVSLEGAALTGATFSGVNLSDASFLEADADGVTLEGVILSRATFTEASLEGSSWVGELLNGVDLTGASLDGADMRNAQFVDVTLTGASFAGSDLRNISMVQQDATAVNFAGARLNGADLAGTNLEGANLDSAALLGADLQLSRYSRQTIWPEGFEFRTVEALGPETRMADFIFPNDLAVPGVDLSEADLARARLNGADLTGARFGGTALGAVSLRGALLAGASFDGTDLSSSDLGGADLSGAAFVEAFLNNADLTGANLTDARVAESEIFGILLSGANLNGTRFSGGFAVDGSVEGAQMAGAVIERTVFGELFNGCPVSLPPRWSCVYAPAFDRFALMGPGGSLEGVGLMGADLSQAELEGVVLDNTVLFDLVGSCPLSLPPGVRCVVQNNGLRAVVGAGVNLSGADLEGVNLAGLDLSNAQLAAATLINADFSGANLSAARLTFSNAAGANFSGADLSGAELERLDLRGADLSGANLTGAFLEDANLLGADLSGADLRGSRPAELAGGCPAALPESWVCRPVPILQDTFFLAGPGVDLSGATLHEVDLSGVDMRECACQRVSFRNASLGEAILLDSDLTSSLLIGAELTGAVLSGAIVEGVDFDGASWSITVCPDGTLSDAHADGTCLRNLDFHRLPAVGQRLTFEGALTPESSRWARPQANCQPDPGVDHAFETVTLVNDGPEDRVVTLDAQWSADGFLHVFRPIFDGRSLEDCVAGNDDFNNNVLASRLVGVSIPAGEAIVVVASTFSGNVFVDSYTLTVEVTR